MSDYDEWDEQQYSENEFSDEDVEEQEYKPDIQSLMDLGSDVNRVLSEYVGSACQNLADQSAINRLMTRPIDRFLCYTKIEAENKLNRVGDNRKGIRSYKIEDGDIIGMIQLVGDFYKGIKDDMFGFPHIGDKNSQAYILGYLASNGGYGITQENFNMVVETTEGLRADYVKSEDILRYARFCQILRGYSGED
jgi:hypothetical protein